MTRRIFSRPTVMGILNVAPDSFSDGGRYTDVDKALPRAVEMAEEGAAIIDIGGESTRFVVLVHPVVFGMDEDELLASLSRVGDTRFAMGRDLMAFDVGETIRPYSRR